MLTDIDLEEILITNSGNLVENIILVGTPRAGKTHYSIGLGIKACMEGKSVLFINNNNKSNI